MNSTATYLDKEKKDCYYQDHQQRNMEQDGRNSRNPRNQLDPLESLDNKTRGSSSIYPIHNTNDEGTDGMVPKPSILGGNRRDSTANQLVQNVDGTGGVPTLPQEGHGCLHIASPMPFTGKKESYHGFWWELGLYLMANWKDFPNDESMVIFALSYMKEGSAARWADAYVDKALDEDDWGKYSNFLYQLAQDFGDKEEPRKALEEMGRIFQGQETAFDYFQRMEQLTSIAGIDIDRTPHILLQMEKGLNSVLVDQLYFSRTPPENYCDYKKRIVDADDMRKWREANQKGKTSMAPKIRDPNAMEVDKQKGKNETRKCYNCNEEGHLARNCQKKEKKQDF
jgi:hypothetical protein